MKKKSVPPRIRANPADPEANARLYPNSAQMTGHHSIRKMHCIISLNTFFLRTSPL